MRTSVKKEFTSFSVSFEGRIHFMYGDIKNLVTTGVGNLIDPIELALPLPWLHADGTAATQDEITAEWNAVKARSDLNHKKVKAYEKITKLRLENDPIDELISEKASAIEARLRKNYPKYDEWPADAQLGILSMSWAMGADFHFPHFKKAVNQDPPDFAAAAANCHMNDSANPGLKPRNAANKLLFSNAAAAAKNHADPETLYYPNAFDQGPAAAVLPERAGVLLGDSGAPAIQSRPPDLSLTATPAIPDGAKHLHDSVELQAGGNVILHWSCPDAAGVRLHPMELEVKGGTGEQPFRVDATTLFSAEALDESGAVIAQAELLVATHEPTACYSPHATVAAAPAPAVQADAHIFDATGLTWWKDDLCHLAATQQDDARKKNLSLAYGLRMYKELLKWELTETKPGSGTYDGCVYSAEGSPALYTTLRKDFIEDGYVEWPGTLPFLPPDAKTRTIKKQDYSLVKAYGVNWILSGATNCTCSQLAALVAAQPDGKFYVRKKKGEAPLAYDVFGESAKIPLDAPSKEKLSLWKIFEGAFAQARKTTLGKAVVFSDLAKGPYQALQLLGLGTYLGKGEPSNDDENLRLARLGDHGSSTGHAFLVGDVIYKVEFAPKSSKGKKGETMRVLQSSFAKGDGELLPMKGGIDFQAKSLSAGDCDALIADEKTFLDKVDRFHAIKAEDTLWFDDQKRKVHSIEVYRIVQFSANTHLQENLTPIAGKFYTAGGKVDDATTKKYAAINGVSREQQIGKNSVVFARFYAHSDG